MLKGAARMASVEPVAAFVDDSHIALAATIKRFCETELAARLEPCSDDEARREARVLLPVLGRAELYAPASTRDLRALVLAREYVAAADPLADAVVALQVLGGVPLALAGTDAQQRRWLDRIVSGDAMAAFAITEPDAGSDVGAIQTTARRDGDGWVLDGEKHLISNAGIADVYMVLARTREGQGSRGLSMFIVPGDSPGLAFGGPQVMAAPHPLGRIRFAACRVGAEALVGEVDAGFKLAMRSLDFVRPSVGAAAIGMAARALTEALAHTTTRRQFGQPLAEFQLVRATLGRMAAELEAARLLVYRAAWQHDTKPGRITLEAAMAKSVATETAQRVIDAAVQMIGGRGVLVGSPVERLYRAVRALRIYEGATDIQHLVIGSALVEQV